MVAVEEEAQGLDRALPTCPVAQEGLRVLEAPLAVAGILVPAAQVVIPEAPALQVVEDVLAQGERLALVATRVAAEVILEEELAGPVPEVFLARELDVLVQAAILAQEVVVPVQAAILAQGVVIPVQVAILGQEVVVPVQAATLEVEATALAPVLSRALVEISANPEAEVDGLATVATAAQVVPEVPLGRVGLVDLVGLVDPAGLLGLKGLVVLEGLVVPEDLVVPEGRLDPEARVVQVATQGREATARVLHKSTPVLEEPVPRRGARVLTWEEVQRGLDPEVGELEVTASVLVLALILAMETPGHKVAQVLLAVAMEVVHPGLARHRQNIPDLLELAAIPVRAAPAQDLLEPAAILAWAALVQHLELVAIPVQAAPVQDLLVPVAIPVRVVPVQDRLDLAATPSQAALVRGLQDPVRNREEAPLGKAPSTPVRTAAVAAPVAMGATTRPEEAVHIRTVRHPTPDKAITLSSPEALRRDLAVGAGADGRRGATEHP